MRVIAGILLLGFLNGCFDSPPNTEKSGQVVKSMAKALAKKHSQIPQLSVKQFNKWQKEKRPHFLVDVRSERARKTSSIPHSMSLEEWKRKKGKKSKPTVFYSTIGIHAIKTIKNHSSSSQLLNLSGGILAWVHAENPVVNRDGKEVKKVFFESRAWNMLPPEYRGVTP